MCAEHCARLGPGGRSGVKAGSPSQPKQQQEEAKEAEEAAKDVEGGSLGPSVAAGAEARPQIPTKPCVPDKPQDLASPQAGRPMPAPRKAFESPTLTPPTPRPRSSLQPENLVEQGGSSLVNGEQAPAGTGRLLGSGWCLNGHMHWEC